jgi:hypothetical protein
MTSYNPSELRVTSYLSSLIHIQSNSRGLHLSQPKYIRDILLRAKINGIKPCPTPCIPDKSLSKFQSTSMTDPQLYHSIVGALQYATITHPDISYDVNKTSQFIHAPISDHWNIIKRILCYLNVPLISVYNYTPNLLSLFMPTMIQIGQDVLMTVDQHLDFVFFLVRTSFHGAPRNNI